MENPYAYVYSVVSYWGPRAESPGAIASRFVRMLSELSRMHPAFSNWMFHGRKNETALKSLSPDESATLIVKEVRRSEDGDPAPQTGYMFGAANGAEGDSQKILINVHAGDTSVANYLINSVMLRTAPFDTTNATFINFNIFKSALLAIADAWDVTWSGAAPWGLLSFRRDVAKLGRPYFDLAWMTYLSPQFGRMVTPPRDATVGRTLNGGLLMIATEERFDFANPTHLAAARAIELALAPVNALPWPPDR